MSELDVYHGTPHRFPATEANPLGEFDASKVGTGEGAQAYGHGVYLAESPAVAEEYRKVLGEQKNPYKANVAMSRMSALVDEFGGDVEKAADRFMQSVYDTPKTKAKMRQGLVEEFKSYSPKGQLYTADLPDQMIDRMLDWDKPLSEQSPYVQKIIGEEIKRIGGGSTLSTGEKAYKELMFQARMEGAESGNSAMKNNAQAIAASKRLKELGIPGIRYLDRQSRIYGKPKFFVENVSADGKVINSFRFDTREEAEKFSATFKKQMKRQLPPEKIGTPRITEREAQQTTSNFVVFPGEEKKVKILERK
jgi:hypothetical protein